jgi:hypothetical protein
MIKPTVDCNKCNFIGTDENNEFRCTWRYPKTVEVVEGNRCKSVVFIEEAYRKAKENNNGTWKK